MRKREVGPIDAALFSAAMMAGPGCDAIEDGIDDLNKLKRRDNTSLRVVGKEFGRDLIKTAGEVGGKIAEVVDEASVVAFDVADAAGKVSDEFGDAASKVGREVAKVASKVGREVVDTASNVSDVVGDVTGDISDKAADTARQVENVARKLRDSVRGEENPVPKSRHNTEVESVVDHVERNKDQEVASLKGYDNALVNEFSDFEQREKKREGKFNYRKATRDALENEGLHLWKSRLENKNKKTKDKESSHKAYYGELLKKSEKERRDFLAKSKEVCEDFNVPLSIALGVELVESRGVHKVSKTQGKVGQSPQGRMQITAAAEDLVRKVYGDKIKNATRDGYWGNFTLSVAYLRIMADFYDGQWGMACKAYASGIGVTDKLIMSEMSEEFHTELKRRKKKPIKGEEYVSKFIRRKIKEHLRDKNVNIVKAYHPRRDGGLGWNDDKDKHSVQYAFFVFHMGKQAYRILNSKGNKPEFAPFFAEGELREDSSIKVAKL